MRYFSTFSGIGGFELGITQAYDIIRYQGKREQQGKKRKYVDRNDLHNKGSNASICVGYSEVDKYAIQVYEKHFNHKNYGDITAIDTATIPDFDLFVGGFPCQAFSIAGKRRGFEDTRGTLFFDCARIIRAKRPRNFILENVKGLLSHDEGNTFKTIITTLDELGYFVEWQVLNSKNFGVPQNRERVFIIGHLGGEPKRKVFPIGEGGKEANELPRHVTNTITTRYEGAQATGSYIGEGKQHAQKIAVPVLTPDRFEKRQNGRRFKEDGEPSFTCTAQDRHGISDGDKIRRLTPAECERLQGFPDGWTEGISDTQRYKCCGNAVTVNVIEAIITKLITAY